jgi:hypothetical protein
MIGQNVKNLSVDSMLHNLDQLLECASAEQWDAGKTWYTRTHDYAVELSGKYNLSLEQTAGVLAVLAPMNNWERNMQDAVSVIECYLDDGCIDEVKVATYPANKEKAYQIVATGDVEAYVRGNKITAFYNNILNAYDETELGVTVDMWAARALVGMPGDKTDLNLSDSAYGKAAEAYRLKAEQHNLLPKQLQAVVWVVVRDMAKGNHKQLANNAVMFCPNCLKPFGHEFIH